MYGVPGAVRILARGFLPLADPIRESPQLDASLPDLIRSVKARARRAGAKRRDSRYASGSLWRMAKMRVNRSKNS
jgi:hypothetical protein